MRCQYNDGYKWRAFVAIAISFVTMVMSSASMNFVALSAIAEEYGETLRRCPGGHRPGAHHHRPHAPTAWVADIIGRRKVHLVGLALFASGTIACALAPLPRRAAARGPG